MKHRLFSTAGKKKGERNRGPPVDCRIRSRRVSWKGGKGKRLWKGCAAPRLRTGEESLKSYTTSRRSENEPLSPKAKLRLEK